MDYHINAKGKPLGRIASQIAGILQGKKSPAYHPRLVGTDRVFLEHYLEIIMTGRKSHDKLYHRHTGYMGHLKTERFKDAFAKNPKNVIWEAVAHMLPKNKLAARRRKHLIFVEA